MKTKKARLRRGSLLAVEIPAFGWQLEKARNALKRSPFVHALFRSQSGYGLTAICNILPDKARLADSFRAVVQEVLRLSGITIDRTALLVETFAHRGGRILLCGKLIRFP